MNNIIRTHILILIYFTKNQNFIFLYTTMNFLRLQERNKYFLTNDL